MEETKVVAILSALAKGVNPITGEIATPDSPYQHADIVRALYAALERLKQPQPSTPKPRPRNDVPSNVGKPWSEEEDQRLQAGFDRGSKPAELARQFGRTLAGIEARLEKLGCLTSQDRTTTNRYPRDQTAARSQTANT